jgi:type II secretory pathway predicted ATPase ExeA
MLIGQPSLLNNMSLSVNADIKSRVTYSTIMKRINPDDMRNFILSQLDRVRLGHNTFSEEALELIVRSSEGVLRRARNLCLSCMLEAVRLQEKQIGLEHVNRVLIQPHWRKEDDLPF